MNPAAGVLLANTGTPEAPTPAAVRRYLAAFLSDRRIVETHPVLWRPVLHGVILRVRPRRSAAKYRAVWREDGSPLAAIGRAQAAGLGHRLGADVSVRVAGSYGSPDVAETLDELWRAGVRRLLVVPMYPQYSGTTTGSVLDAVHRHERGRRDQFELRTIRSFPLDAGYLDAVAAQIESRWRAIGRPDFAAGARLLLSFHGIPQAAARAGDPYPDECEATAAALRARLAVDATQCLVTYQSKFGPAPWLTPATIETVRELGAAGCPRLDVAAPGFTADCLETLEELDELNRAAFVAAGGGRFERIECLNDSAPWLDALTELCRSHLTGWLE